MANQTEYRDLTLYVDVIKDSLDTNVNLTADISLGRELHILDMDLSSYGFATKTWVEQQHFATQQDINLKFNQIYPWARSAVKPEYYYNEIKNRPTSITYFNDADSFVLNLFESQSIPWSKVVNKPTTLSGYGITDAFDGDYMHLINRPTIPEIPSKISYFTNDVGYLTQHQDLSNYVTNDALNSALEELGIPVEKPYSSLVRLDEYLYDISFVNLPEYIDSSNNNVGGCTSFVRDGKLYRNLDWYYDKTPSFFVHCKEFDGMAFDNTISDSNMSDEKLGQLPYRIVDGINRYGIAGAVHVLYNDFDWHGDANGTVPLTKALYMVLTNVKSMTSIVEDCSSFIHNFKLNDAWESLDYLLQLIITDGTTTYVMTPTNGGYQLVNITDNPKLANFKWVNHEYVERGAEYIQLRPTGIERWNTISDITKLDDLRFTKCYEEPNRLSEFIGLRNTTKNSSDADLLSIYETAHAWYNLKERNGQLWQTMHSIVYNPSELRIEHLWVQENWNKDFIASTGEVVVPEQSLVVDAYITENDDIISCDKSVSDLVQYHNNGYVVRLKAEFFDAYMIGNVVVATKSDIEDPPVIWFNITTDNGTALLFMGESTSEGDIWDMIMYSTESEIQEAISNLLENPSGGTVGQVLTKTVDGAEWADVPTGPDIEIVDNLEDTSSDKAISARAVNEDLIEYIDEQITTIDDKIPSSASSTNQLADKNFVNSSLNSITAFYITKDAQGTQFATKAQLDSTTVFYSGGEVRTPTRNDYCIVLADETKTDSVTGEDPTTRYIYQNGQWEFQYVVNKTTLTASQLSAVNSGITSSKITQYDDYETSKQDKINDLSTIRSGAELGATAYQKPSTGIPENDLSNSVKQMLNRVFVAEYGTTTNKAIKDAFDAGKHVVCFYNSRLYSLYVLLSTTVYLSTVVTTNVYYVSVNSNNVWSNGTTNIQSISNLRTSWASTPDNTHYPSEKLVKDSIDLKVNEPSTEGSNGQVLTTDGNGGRSWTTVSGGTSSYNDLSNKPQINSVELTGDKSLADIGAAAASHSHGSIGSGGTISQNLSSVPNNSRVLITNPTNSKIYGSPFQFSTASGSENYYLSKKGTFEAVPSGGISNHDFTFSSLANNTTSFTFPANQRCYQYVSVSATSVMNFAINNGSDNYVRIHNSGSSDAILAINTVTHNGTTVGNIIAPAEIKCAAGKYIEISVIYDGANAVFTVSGDLQNLN